MANNVISFDDPDKITFDDLDKLGPLPVTPHEFTFEDFEKFSRHRMLIAENVRVGKGKGLLSNLSIGIDKALGGTPGVAGDALVYFGSVVRKGADGALLPGPAKTLGDRMFTAGRIMQEKNISALRKRFPEEDLGKVEQFAQDLGSGAVSLAAAIGVGVAAGPAAAGVAFGVTETIGSFTEARRKEKSFKEAAAISAALGFVEGSLEFVGLDRLINVSGGVIKRIIKSAVTEGIQEFSQATLGESIRATTGLRKFEGLKTVFDIFTQAMYEGALGAVLGIGASIPISIAQRRNVEDAIVRSGADRKQARIVADNILQTGMDAVITEVEKIEPARKPGAPVRLEDIEKRKATPEQVAEFKALIEKRKGRITKVDKISKFVDKQLEEELAKSKQRVGELEVAKLDVKLFKEIKEQIPKIKRRNKEGQIIEELRDVPDEFINNQTGRPVDEVLQEVNNAIFLPQFESTSEFIEGLIGLPKQLKAAQSQVEELRPAVVQRRETTVLKEKIASIKRGFRLGKITGREQVLTTQKELKSILAESELDPKDRLKFQSLIDQISGAADPVAALKKNLGVFEDRIQELERAAGRRAEIAKFQELTQKRDIKMLRPEFQKPIQSLIEQFDPKKISKGKLRDLQKLVEFIEREPGNQLPQSRLNELKRLEKKQLTDLSVEDIQNINAAIGHFIKLNLLKNKIIVGRKIREFNEIRDKAVENVDRRFGELEGSVDGLDSFQQDAGPSWWKKLLSFAGIDSYNAELVTEILDGESAGIIKEVFYEGVDQGTNEQLLFQFQAEDFFKRKIGKIDISKWSSAFQKKKKNVEQISFTIESGKTLRMTKGEKIALALHGRNVNNERHLVEGGFNFKETPAANPIKLTLTDLARLEESLTSEELQVADAVFEYLNTVQKDGINKVSVDLLGHEVAVEENYFPIRTNFLDIFRDKLIKAGNVYQVTLEGLGIFKARQAATNSIILEDVFLATYKSIHQTSAYVGLARPLRSAKALLTDKAFQVAVRRAGKPEYLRMLDRYIKKVEGVNTNLDNVDQLAAKLINQMDLSVLGLNPFVMMKQPASYFGAATEIDWKFLKPAFKPKLNQTERAEMARWSPQLRDRLDGNVTRELGELAEVGRPMKFFTGKVVNSQKIMDGIREFDAITIGSIWRAVKLEVAEKQPDLKGDAFFEKVASRAWEITRLTQPTFNVKDRSTIGMSDNQLIRFLTKYTSQRNKNWMMYRRGFEQYNRSHKTPRDKAKLGLVMFTVGFLSPIYIQLIDMIRNLVLGQLRKEPLQYQIFTGWLKNNIGSIYFLGPGFSSFLSKIERSTFSGFDVNEPVTDTFNDFIDMNVEAFNSIKFALTRERYKSSRGRGERKWKNSLRRFTADSMDFAGRIFGKPIAFWRKLAHAQFNWWTGR